MAFGLYGNNLPAYKFGGVKYSFLNAEVLKDTPEWEYIVHQSIINGHRTFKRKGAHWVVEMILNLYKAGGLDDIHDEADFIQNLLWDKTAFTYYRHSSGSELKDANGDAVEFRLVEFRPFNREVADYRDAVFIKFISLDYVKVAPTETGS